MNLGDYIKKQKLSLREFARQAKVSPQTLYNVMQKPRNTSVRILDLVVSATGGEVTIEDLLQ